MYIRDQDEINWIKKFIHKNNNHAIFDIEKKKNILNELKCKKAIIKANKLMGKNGRLLVRKSGTEPKIRIMGESHNKNLILNCIKIIKRSIKN